MKQLLMVFLGWVLGFAVCCAVAIGQESAKPAEVLPQFETRVHAEGESKLPYRLLVPKDYDKAHAWPLIIWLHGSGEIGDNNTAPIRPLGSTFLADKKRCPAFVMVPQCPPGDSWLGVGLNKPAEITEASRLVIATIAELRQEFNIDDRRLYISGFSMGSCGAWDLLSRYPNLFAAAVHIAGPPGDRPGLAPIIKHLPLWVFHGDRDNTAPVESSRTIVAALKEAGSNVKYTEYRGGGHELARPLAEPDLLPWLLAQQRTEPADFTQQTVPDSASLITKTLPDKTRGTWKGPAERTRHAVPSLAIDNVRYRLKAASHAKPGVEEFLTKIGQKEFNGNVQLTGTIELTKQAWILVEEIEAK
ncbi:esterase [Anatilimnocola aggregata]|uniref:Esterase n=1 Tax=Anatilimnocola aggregata TaxID=2528021 RepID=A0A517Y684_9BACT|nr:dienelactone hydrolase family protein [Anatilimnocola aggregata]QDU25726.1 esterase [Anatilimnocola aggregata]